MIFYLIPVAVGAVASALFYGKEKGKLTGLAKHAIDAGERIVTPRQGDKGFLSETRDQVYMLISRQQAILVFMAVAWVVYLIFKSYFQSKKQPVKTGYQVRYSYKK